MEGCVWKGFCKNPTVTPSLGTQPGLGTPRDWFSLGSALPGSLEYPGWGNPPPSLNPEFPPRQIPRPHPALELGFDDANGVFQPQQFQFCDPLAAPCGEGKSWGSFPSSYGNQSTAFPPAPSSGSAGKNHREKRRDPNAASPNPKIRPRMLEKLLLRVDSSPSSQTLECSRIPKL